MTMYIAEGPDGFEQMMARIAADKVAAKERVQDFQWPLMDGAEHYFLSLDPPSDGNPPIIIVGRITPWDEADEDIASSYDEEEDDIERADLIVHDKESLRADYAMGYPRNVFWDSYYEPDGVGDYHTIHASMMLPITEEQFQRFRSHRQDFWKCREDKELSRLLSLWVLKVIGGEELSK